jgi:hypothetical protein
VTTAATPPIVGTETYVSFADANALAADRLDADEWRAAVAAYEADQTADPAAIPVLCRQALITATATLDRLTWLGEPASPSQPLAWPRRCLSVAADTIPQALATACAELAFYLLTPESTRRRDVQMQMIGQSLETYFPEVADELPIHVRRLVAPFLRVRSRHSVELIP